MQSKIEFTFSGEEGDDVPTILLPSDGENPGGKQVNNEHCFKLILGGTMAVILAVTLGILLASVNSRPSPPSVYNRPLTVNAPSPSFTNHMEPSLSTMEPTLGPTTKHTPEPTAWPTEDVQTARFKNNIENIFSKYNLIDGTPKRSPAVLHYRVSPIVF